jgi:hypothetical protein
MVMCPSFSGAEPDQMDEGEYTGLSLFRKEKLKALKFMQNVNPQLQEQATLSVWLDWV